MKPGSLPALRVPRRLALCVVLPLATACAGVAAPDGGAARGPAGECAAPALDPAGHLAVERVRWLVRSADADRGELDAWCRGVGAPVVATVTAADVGAVDALPVITWNVHLGEAHVDSLVADLRSGELTGAPAEHFVLLVQEARRLGTGVPATLEADARGARRLGRHDAGYDGDIVATAHRLGLQLFYAPSMRNGGAGHPAEDRGNAILSTLPLSELTAIELPLLAQRRVAVAATIPLIDAAGIERSLRVTSVHLDYGASRTRPLAPFGNGRAIQAGALASALAGAGNSIVGGDFNTWLPDRMERGLAIMRDVFPDLADGAGAPTHYTAGFWPRRLDRLFLRAADANASTAERIDRRYGSDHYPVMTWLSFAAR